MVAKSVLQVLCIVLDEQDMRDTAREAKMYS